MSPAARFKRALVSMLLQLAHAYGLTLSLNRDSSDDVMKTCFKKVMLRVHPDKPGGSEAKAKGLNDAWDKWTNARRAKGRPPTRSTPFHGGEMCAVPAPARKKKEFRVQAKAVMLTYQGLKDTSSWAFDALAFALCSYLPHTARKKLKKTMCASIHGRVHA